MRESEAYPLEELGSQTAVMHLQGYLNKVSGRSIQIEEDDLETTMKETPEQVLETDTLNSAQSYIIPYRRSGPGPGTGFEVLDLYDTGEEIIVSGEGRYLESAREILESDNPSLTYSRELFSHRVQQGLKDVKSKLGG